MSQISNCSQADCCVLTSKMNSKDSRIISCIQPQCSNIFHAKCIGWNTKSVTEFNIDVQVFLCDACIKYVSAISAHIANEVKCEILSSLTTLQTKVDNLENKITTLQNRIIDLEKKDTDYVSSFKRLTDYENEVKNLSCSLNKLDAFEADINNVKLSIAKFSTLQTDLNKHSVSNNKLTERVTTLETSASAHLNTAGNTIASTDPEIKYKLCFSGVPEVECKDKVKRQETDVNHIHAITEFLGLGSPLIREVHRYGKYDNERTSPRMLSVTFQSVWEPGKILAAANKLKSYHHKIFVRRVLSKSEYAIEKQLLKKRWELIQSGIPRQELKIKSLNLYHNDVIINLDN